MRKLLFLLALLAGVGFAIAPVTGWTAGATGKYSQAAAPAVTTEGGNVSNINVSQSASTEKWAGFWGNITGGLYLAPDTTNIFYQWTGFDITGSTLCAVAGTGFDWGAVTATTGSSIDSVWGFVGTDADSGANTFTGSGSVQLAGSTITSAAADTGAAGGFVTVVIADTATPAAKADLAFCVSATVGGTLFNGQQGDYELMVATDEAPGATETYNFWLELH